ncbi:MAG: helix-turn-helix transcriptional regulator [Campylobacteraceae bacterium]|nr:helix-turn-helix transcriptional regulator [Campylobacteraceae bacterium]
MMNIFTNSTQSEVDIFHRKISRNIKRRRLERNLKQIDVALEIGINSVAFYSNCENCKYGKHFNLGHIYKIAKFFNIEPYELLK